MFFRSQSNDLTPDELREILRLPNHVIAIIRPDGTFYKVNEEANPVLGWEPHEVVGKPAKNYVHPEDWEETFAHMTRAFLGSVPFIEDVRNRSLRKDGTWRWISWTGRAKGGLIYAHGVDITEKIEYEEALTVQSLVLESISEGVVIANIKGVMVFANTAAEKLYGYDTEELLGKKVYILSDLSREESARKVQEVLSAIESDGVWMGEFENIRKDGTPVTTSCRITLLDLHGEKHFVCVQRDISAKKRLSQEREELEERFRLASESLSLAVKVGNVGIWEWLPLQNKVVWDETTEALYGYPKGAFSQETQHYLEHLHPDDRERCWKIVNEALEKHESYTMDHRIIRKDGEIRWILGTGQPFYGSNGEVTRVIGTAIDITERKEQEENQRHLSQLSEILSSSFDYVGNLQKAADILVSTYFDGIIIDEILYHGGSQRIVASNNIPVYQKLMVKLHQDYSHKWGADHPFVKAVASERTVILEDMNKLFQVSRFPEDYRQSIASLQMGAGIVTALHGKERKLGLMAFHLRKGRGPITERHKYMAKEAAYRIGMAMENSILYHNSQEAIRARDEFLSIASHELKTPLQSLVLQNDMRKRMITRGATEAVEPQKLLLSLQKDQRQLSRINRLIDDMLDISRIRNSRLSIMKEKINLSSLMDDIIDRLFPQFCASGCDIERTYEKDIFLEGDSYRLEQVIVNIFTNAIKYGAGGKIHVTMTGTTGKIKVMIKDEGPGIAPQDLERIFERFERASSQSVSGLGLGLYISRQIVNLHGGTIHAESALGNGACFIMELPR